MKSTLCYNLEITDDQYDFILNSEHGKFLEIDVLETKELLEIFALDLPQHSSIELTFSHNGNCLEIKSEIISMFHDNFNNSIILTIRKPVSLLIR